MGVAAPHGRGADATMEAEQMLTLWSELPGARVRELAVDAGTLLWIALWVEISRRLYQIVVGFAGTGRFVREGGRNLDTAGQQMGAALGGVPVIGHQVGDLVRSSIGFAARPFLTVGLSLEHMFQFLAALVGLTVLVISLGPWLYRYVPWRWARVSGLRAAVRVVRASPHIGGEALEQLLASRAVHRLSYAELLRYSPDPFGDWARGDYEGLARAELASAGLRYGRRGR